LVLQGGHRHLIADELQDQPAGIGSPDQLSESERWWLLLPDNDAERRSRPMSPTLQRVRFTTAEYTRMASILAGRRTELIDGAIIEMAPIGTAHLLVVSRLQHQLEQGIAGPGVRVLVQQPVIVDQFDEPQPDLVILRDPLGSRKPRARDCLVVIEVSDSTYATDTAIKVPAYLAGGVPEVWIVNIANHADPVVEVWTPGASQPTRARDVVRVAGITVPLVSVFDGLAAIPDEEA
jgi:Uma2 family endonuclease